MESYEEFVLAASGALYRTAYLLCGNRYDAEDLLQTTLVKLYVDWRRAAASHVPLAYSRKTLVNTFVSSRRPLRFRRERLFAAVPDGEAVSVDPGERLSVWPHVAALPPRQRAVVILRYYEDLSEQQIADTLGCARGTVKSTASAALRRLRQLMEEER